MRAELVERRAPGGRLLKAHRGCHLSITNHEGGPARAELSGPRYGFLAEAAVSQLNLSYDGSPWHLVMYVMRRKHWDREGTHVWMSETWFVRLPPAGEAAA